MCRRTRRLSEDAVSHLLRSQSTRGSVLSCSLSQNRTHWKMCPCIINKTRIPSRRQMSIAYGLHALGHHQHIRNLTKWFCGWRCYSWLTLYCRESLMQGIMGGCLSHLSSATVENLLSPSSWHRFLLWLLLHLFLICLVLEPQRKDLPHWVVQIQ